MASFSATVNLERLEERVEGIIPLYMTRPLDLCAAHDVKAVGPPQSSFKICGKYQIRTIMQSIRKRDAFHFSIL